MHEEPTNSQLLLLPLLHLHLHLIRLSGPRYTVGKGHQQQHQAKGQEVQYAKMDAGRKQVAERGPCRKGVPTRTFENKPQYL
ncbi:GH13799 [Drosophila grimshawi]|uniref:GH13799 n=1 Tax=Drosophila grimshawi TaxID=7222 RepID=B4JR13_DROGR|nr:GH13799 [Drosophila grimshawi]